jgi:ribosome-associated translation inhibitor RaiA
LQIDVSAHGAEVHPNDREGIEQDLQKLDRRLQDQRDVTAKVRISKGEGAQSFHIVLDVHYGHNHLIAKEDDADVRRAVREAREEILRQIKDRSRGGHSSIAKHA